MRYSRSRIRLTRLPHVGLARLFFIVVAIAVTMFTMTGMARGAPLLSDSGSVAAVPLQLTLSPVITSGLTQPVYLTNARDNRLFIVERAGVIRIYQNGSLLSQPFLD